MRDKKTTAQVAKAFGLNKSQLIHMLQKYPALRPAERGGNLRGYLWSEDEFWAISVHLDSHPRRGKRIWHSYTEGQR